MGATSNNNNGSQCTEMMNFVINAMGDRALQDEERKWMLESGATASTGVLWGDDFDRDDEDEETLADEKEFASERRSADPSQRSKTWKTTKTSIAIHRVKFLVAFLCGLSAIALAVILTGAHYEAVAFRNAPSTLALYTDERVCGIRNPDQTMSPSFLTFHSAEQAHEDDADVAHCGACGHCSNEHDVDIQAQTASTLTSDSRVCAFRIFWGGSAVVDRCLDRAIGFTEPCRNCWTENIQCTYQHCKFTCLKTMYLLGDKDTNEEDGTLNPCLQCDEKMCGPSFLECSGSNRRRLGIVSDIERDSTHEQCTGLDIDWNLFG